MTIQRVGVYCGAAAGNRAAYIEAAAELGSLIAGRGWGLVYGGGHRGLMGAVADAALTAGGEVIGVIPQSLVEKELAHGGLTEMHVVETMHERKARMIVLSDAFITLPGGFGTLEEFAEIVSWGQMALHQKPCALLNTEGFYTPLLRFFDHIVAEGLTHPGSRALIIAEETPEDLLQRLDHYAPPIFDRWAQ